MKISPFAGRLGRSVVTGLPAALPSRRGGRGCSRSIAKVWSMACTSFPLRKDSSAFRSTVETSCFHATTARYCLQAALAHLSWLQVALVVFLSCPRNAVPAPPFLPGRAVHIPHVIGPPCPFNGSCAQRHGASSPNINDESFQILVGSRGQTPNISHNCHFQCNSPALLVTQVSDMCSNKRVSHNWP